MTEYVPSSKNLSQEWSLQTWLILRLETVSVSLERKAQKVIEHTHTYI